MQKKQHKSEAFASLFDCKIYSYSMVIRRSPKIP